MFSIIDLFGWFGVALVLAAYSFSYTDYLGQGFTYRVMNFVGASLIALTSVWGGLLSVAVLNIVWAMISLAAIRKMFSENLQYTVSDEPAPIDNN